MLAVDIDQLLAGLAQLRHGGAAAVDPGAALSLRIDGAAHEQRPGIAGIGIEAGFGQPGHEGRRQIELGRDLGPRRAFAHHAGIAAAAEGELQGIDEDRFAGPGLAGEHGQAGREIELEGVDDDEIANGKAQQHRLLSPLPAAQWSLRRKVAK